MPPELKIIFVYCGSLELDLQNIDRFIVPIAPIESYIEELNISLVVRVLAIRWWWNFWIRAERIDFSDHVSW